MSSASNKRYITKSLEMKWLRLWRWTREFLRNVGTVMQGHMLSQAPIRAQSGIWPAVEMTNGLNLLIKIEVERAVGTRQRCAPSRHQSFGAHTRWEHTVMQLIFDSRQAQTFLYPPQHEERLWEPSSPLFYDYCVVKHPYFEATYLPTFIAELRN